MGPLRSNLALPLPDSLAGAFPGGDVPESQARLVKTAAREITREDIYEYLKVPGTARSLLICLRSAERVLAGTSGNTFILALAFFIASELHWGKRYMVPGSPDGLAFLQGDAAQKEVPFDDPGANTRSGIQDAFRAPICDNGCHHPCHKILARLWHSRVCAGTLFGLVCHAGRGESILRSK